MTGRASAWIWLRCVCVVMAMGSEAWGETAPQADQPTPLGYVSDYAGVLSPEWHQQVRTICQDLENRNGVEMLVVTLESIAPSPHARQYATRLYEAWRIGTAQQERGILLLVAIKERQAVVVVGKSLLPLIPPQQLEEISSSIFQPMFRNGEYGVNVYRAAVLLSGSAGKAPSVEDPRPSRRHVAFWMNVGVVLLMLYALWRFTRPERSHPFVRWKRGAFWTIGQGGFGGPWGGFGGTTGGNRMRE
jgi:uncharacterized protein